MGDNKKDYKKKELGSIFFHHEVKNYNRKGESNEEYAKELIIDGSRGLTISYSEKKKGKYLSKYIREKSDGTYDLTEKEGDKEKKEELTLTQLKAYVKKELKFASDYINKQRGTFSGGSSCNCGSEQCGGAKKASKKASKKSSKKLSKKSSKKSSRKSSKKSSNKQSGGAKKKSKSKKSKTCNCGNLVGGKCEKCNSKKVSKKASKKRSKKSSRKN